MQVFRLALSVDFLRSSETDIGAFAAIQPNRRERRWHVGWSRQTSLQRLQP